MPLFEYACDRCGEKFEELVLGRETGIVCPKCGSDEIHKLVSVFASSGDAGLSLGSSCGGGSGFR
ncbi:MAG TPA: zinc ribbon domain-containing protein [candidate division Zixibacteria bacterium]|nr:zinc ribbon domain-containing protein [candidate division Zixibacteria bacterium]